MFLAYWLVLLLSLLGLGFLVIGFWLLWRILRSKDKSVMLSFILERDDCSRILGEYNDKYLKQSSQVVIAWKNGQAGHGGVLKPESTDDKAAIALLLTAINEIGEKHGIKASVVCG